MLQPILSFLGSSGFSTLLFTQALIAAGLFWPEMSFETTFVGEPYTANYFLEEWQEVTPQLPYVTIDANSDLVRPDCRYNEALEVFYCPSDRFIDIKIRSPRQGSAFHLESLDAEINYAQLENLTDRRVRVGENYRLVHDPLQGPQDYLDIGVAGFGAAMGQHSMIFIHYPFPGVRMLDEKGQLLPVLESETALRAAEEPACYFDREEKLLIVKAFAQSDEIEWFHLEPGEDERQGR